VCDFMMAELDGIGFREALAARDVRWLARLAFMTGGAFGERATRFLAETDVVMLPKPVERAALLDLIEDLAAPEARRLTRASALG
jgi:CheY-like chemotaxis protein